MLERQNYQKKRNKREHRFKWEKKEKTDGSKMTKKKKPGWGEAKVNNGKIAQLVVKREHRKGTHHIRWVERLQKKRTIRKKKKKAIQRKEKKQKGGRSMSRHEKNGTINSL